MEVQLSNFFLFLLVHVIRYSVDYISISSNKDFLKADPNCPGNVVTAFAAIEKLKNQGSQGTKFINFLNNFNMPSCSSNYLYFIYS